MTGASNPMDNVAMHVGLLNDLERDRKVDPPDVSMINGRPATPHEAEVIAAARKAEREACAALVPQKKPEQDDPALPA